ncbi:MAG TPA: carboxypeptidase regulatory-like domain-containing protein [Terriglobia bacterium]|nr:carboxypeptidase regulatory-like domain-containing protein [Terriglobia bacterium]
MRKNHWNCFQSCLLAFTILAASALSAPPLMAQEITGGITGTVTDPSGAAVPGAKVTATDVLRGTTWPTETNAAGVYNLPRLPVGQYKVQVEAKGFTTSVHPAFELQMNQIARIDFQLKVGEMTQTVSVTSAPPLLQTDTMQLGYVTSSNFNVNLPLATRNFIQLTLLTPGVTATNPSSFTNGQRTTGGGRPYVNGNRKEANNFLLNGIDNNQISDNLTSYQPSVDAIQEFDMITNNAPAQYGQFQGGVISVTLKSGTDQYHGDAFEFLRNDALNANNWARNWQHLPTPGLRWNTFGGTFGGPIKKDKLFFFTDYQGARLDSPPATSFFTVMTPAERAGDFSELLNPPAGSGLSTPRPLYNPCASLSGPCTPPANPAAVRQPFPNNIIPSSMIDPVAQKLFASGLYPNPANSNLLNNALNTSHTYTDNDQGDIKIDYMVNDKNHLWGSYSQGFQQNPTTNSFKLFAQSFNNSPFHGGVIDWTHTFTPSVVMDAKMGVNRILLHSGGVVTGVGNLGQQLGIADANVHGPGLLGLNFTNGLASSLGASDSEQLFADTTLEPTFDLIVTHNRHVFHLGLQVLREDINTYYAGNNGKFGFLSFSGVYTDGPDPTSPAAHSGLPEADFLLGLPNTVGLGIAAGTWGQRSTIIAPYIQDDWRATERLTLNLGVRWNYNSPWGEVFSREANFAPFTGVEEFASGALMGPCPELLGSANCVVTNSKAVYNAYWRDWQPRIGFAYTPGFLGKTTVLRGAYTISSFLEGTGTNLRLPLNPPFQSEFEQDNSTGSFPFFPSSITDQGLSLLSVPSNPYAGTNIRLWDPNVRPDQVQQWNLSIEHQFPSLLLLSVAYVGQHGTHLMVPMPYFQRRLVGEAGCTAANAIIQNPKVPVPTCGSPYLSGDMPLYNTIGQISGTESNGDQAYDALQVSLTKRLTRGLEFQFSYAYSKAMTNSIGYYGEGGQAANNSAYWQNLYNSTAEWGPAYFDTTHNLVFSYVYQLPYGSGKRFGSHANPVARAVFGDWQISGIVSDHTGFPLTITGPDNSQTHGRGGKANCIGPNAYPQGAGLGTTWFSTSPFSVASIGTFGSCANGTVRGPGLRDWDFGIEKDFPISESKRFEFRSEFINFTNTPIFNAPNRSVTSAQFGELLSSQYERNIQFALKFYF